LTRKPTHNDGTTAIGNNVQLSCAAIAAKDDQKAAKPFVLQEA
jgi:hypothetical protein